MVGDTQRHHCRPVLSHGRAKKDQPKNELGMLFEHGPEEKFFITRYGETAEEK